MGDSESIATGTPVDVSAMTPLEKTEDAAPCCEQHRDVQLIRSGDRILCPRDEIGCTNVFSPTRAEATVEIEPATLAVGENELNAAGAVLMTAANVLIAKLPQATTHLPALLAEAVKVAEAFVQVAYGRDNLAKSARS